MTQHGPEQHEVPRDPALQEAFDAFLHQTQVPRDFQTRVLTRVRQRRARHGLVGWWESFGTWWSQAWSPRGVWAATVCGLLSLACNLGLGYYTWKHMQTITSLGQELTATQAQVRAAQAEHDQWQAQREVQVIPRPFGAMLDLLELLQKHAETHDFGLKVRLVNKEGKKSPVYMQGENLIIEVTTPAQFASFVYVDYYSTDGQVQHLFPNFKESLNFLPPGSVYTVGQRDDKHVEWKARPPFGRELITVIASQTRLFSGLRAVAEPAESYLNELRQALSKESVPPAVTATFHFIWTNNISPVLSPVRK